MLGVESWNPSIHLDGFQPLSSRGYSIDAESLPRLSA